MLIICLIYGSSRLNHGWLLDPQWSSACSEAEPVGTLGPSWPTRPSLVPRLPTQNLLLTARTASLKLVGSRRIGLARLWAVRTWFVGFWGWIRVSIVSGRISNIATGFCDPAFLWESTDCYISKRLVVTITTLPDYTTSGFDEFLNWTQTGGSKRIVLQFIIFPLGFVVIDDIKLSNVQPKKNPYKWNCIKWK